MWRYDILTCENIDDFTGLKFVSNITIVLKDIRFNCYCASLLRTQIHMLRQASSARAKYYNEQWLVRWPLL